MKAKHTPHLQQGGTKMADEFLSLLLELESLNPQRLREFGAQMRRSHIPNKTS